MPSCIVLQRTSSKEPLSILSISNNLDSSPSPTVILTQPSDGEMETEEEAPSAPSSSSASEWKVPQVKTVMPLSDTNIRYSTSARFLVASYLPPPTCCGRVCRGADLKHVAAQ
jgi:hypothetical protein